MKRLLLLLIISLSVSSFLVANNANTAEAVCIEYTVKDENGNDRIFSTFGEGRCPPGSKTSFGSSSKSDLDSHKFISNITGESLKSFNTS